MTSGTARICEPASRRQPNVRNCLSGQRPARILELRSASGAGGGPEKTILRGSACADPARFAITVCYVRDEKDTTFDLDVRAADLGLDYTEIRQRGPFDWHVFLAVQRVVRARGIQLIHAHDYKTNLLALALARCERVIPLSTAHGWTGQSWRERLIYYPADKRLLVRFPRVLAVSSEIRQELIRYGAAPARVQTILNGIDGNAFHRQAGRRDVFRTRLGLQPADVVVGSMGRLCRQKRFDLLLETFAKLREWRPSLKLLIAGEGEERANLESIARGFGFGDSCRLLGHLPDVTTFYPALDVFVQSSEYEGTPNVILEAMALETPIVATDVGGTRELIEDEVQGLIVQRGDIDALASAVARVLDRPEEAQQRVSRARRRVRQELSFGVRQRRVEEVYEEILGLGPARSKATGSAAWQ